MALRHEQNNCVIHTENYSANKRSKGFGERSYKFYVTCVQTADCKPGYCELPYNF